MRNSSVLLIVLFILFNSCNFSKPKMAAAGIDLDANKLSKQIDSLIKFDKSSTPFRALNAAFQLAEKVEDEEVLAVFHKIKRNEFRKKDTLGVALVYRCLGDFFDDKQVADSAFFYYNQSEKMYRLSPDNKEELARVILYKSGILNQVGILSEAEVETIKALNLLANENNTRLEYEATVQLAVIQKKQKEKSALKYYDKIPHLLNQLKKEGYSSEKLNRSWLSYYNNLGNYYREFNNPVQSKKYYELALKEDYVSDFPTLHARLLNNYASALIDLRSNHQMIDSLLNKSFDIRLMINHKEGIVGSYFTKGQFYLMQQDTVNAVKYMKKAYKLSVEEKLNSDILQTLEFLVNNDPPNSTQYQKEYYFVKDSLYEIEKQTRSKFARIAYETGEIKEHNAFLQQRNFYLLLLVICTSITAGAIFIIFRLRMRNRKLYYQRKEQNNIRKIQGLIEKQHEISDNVRNEERDRIATDLHDSVINRVFSTRINLEKLRTDELQEKQKLVDQLKACEQQVREISHDIVTNIFHKKQNFSSVIEDLVSTQENDFSTTFKCSVDKTIHWDSFTIEQKTQMYFILQELLQNVNKHSKASNCFVLFLQKEEKLVMRVHDDGVGYDATKPKNKGIGLKSIQRRTAKLQGVFKTKRTNTMTESTLEIPYT